jgi:hypothetical protein
VPAAEGAAETPAPPPEGVVKRKTSSGRPKKDFEVRQGMRLSLPVSGVRGWCS